MNLETWIETATENLAPKAVEKVREDILMHIDNAVQRYQLERHSELEAFELAVRDLGDAKIAARGFEKAYLTVKELETFITEKKGTSNQLWFGFIWFTFFIFSLYNNLKLYNDLKSLQVQSIQISWSTTAFYCILAFNNILSGSIARNFSLHSYIIARIILQIFNLFTLILVSIWMTFDVKSIHQKMREFDPSRIKSDEPWFFLIFNVVLIVAGSFLLFLLRKDYLKWRKLRFL